MMKRLFGEYFRWLLIVNCLVVFVFFDGKVNGAENPDNYIDMFSFQKSYTYMKTDGTYTNIYLSGFRNRGDLTDSKILCGKESVECPDYFMTAQFDFYEEMESQELRLKVYLPPGTKTYGLILLFPRDAKVAALVKYGQPMEDPAGHVTYDDYLFSELHAESAGGTWEELKRGFIQTNGGGHATLMDSGFATPHTAYRHDGIPTWRSSWIYVRLKVFSPLAVYKAQYGAIVDVASYLQWYRSLDEEHWKEFGTPEVVEYPYETPTTTTPTTGSTTTPSTGGTSDRSGGDSFYNVGEGTTTPNTNTGGFFPDPTTTPSTDPTPTQDSSGESSNGGGVFYGGNNDSSDPTPSTDTTQPPSNLFQFTLAGRKGQAAMEANIHTVQGDPTGKTIIPKLTLQNTPFSEDQALASYAGLQYNGKLYLAHQDHLGNYVFVQYQDGDRIKPYGTYFFSANTPWRTDAFDDLTVNSTYRCAKAGKAIKGDDIVFYYAVAPPGNLDEARGATFKFIP